MSVVVRRLREEDPVAEFRCGDHRLDLYIRKHAKKNARMRLSATWGAFEDDRLVGYVTVVPGDVPAASLVGTVDDLPPYATPVLLIARMATHKAFQGRGVGRLLLAVVYAAARQQAELGCVGVVTDAKPGAVAFYEHAGFVSLAAPATPEETTPMFLPMRLLAP